ncbi:MAG: MCE family protein [Desulfuromonadaceae bacterium]|nr:MCE family protein [Desulfuromonadaceae bacterium]
METRAHYVLIGLFTVVVAASAMLFGLWLAKSGDGQHDRLYDVLFNEAVNGLSVGNKVEYSGIVVGEVKQLSLDPQDPRKVWARIEVNDTTPIRENTQARLALANITGASNIQLSNGTPDSPMLRAREGRQLPLIVAEPSPLSKLKLNSNEILLSMNELIANAKLLLSQENVHHVSRMIEHLESLTGALEAQKGEVGQGLRDLALAAREGRELMVGVNRLVGVHGKELFATADQTLTSLNQTAGRLDRLVNDNAESFTLGMQGVNELGSAIREFRQTLATLGRIAKQLEDNPAEYLLGGERIKEFQP